MLTGHLLATILTTGYFLGVVLASQMWIYAVFLYIQVITMLRRALGHFPPAFTIFLTFHRPNVLSNH